MAQRARCGRPVRRSGPRSRYPRARRPELPRQSHQPLLLLQDRVVEPAGAAGARARLRRRVRRHERGRSRTRTICPKASTGRGAPQERRPAFARRSPRSGSPRRQSARRPANWACRPGTLRRPPVSRAACNTACRSRRRACAKWSRRKRSSGSWACAATCACGTAVARRASKWSRRGSHGRSSASGRSSLGSRTSVSRTWS